ncbi:hypothetical protein ES703_102147 [subsurface metagenome]
MDVQIKKRAQELRAENPEMSIPRSWAIASEEKEDREGVPADSREPGCDDELDANTSGVGELLPEVLKEARESEEFPLDKGPRAKPEPKKKPGPAKRGKKKPVELWSFPMRERLKRAALELSDAEFKEFIILWAMRGAPAKGPLRYFTIKSLARFSGHSRRGTGLNMKSMMTRGWVSGNGYSKYFKKEYYWLPPIETIPEPGESGKESAS